LGGFANGVVDLLLLVMVRVISLFATQNYGAGKTGMAELTMGAFPPCTGTKPACSKSAISWRIFRGMR